jgi:hypothetical protein
MKFAARIVVLVLIAAIFVLAARAYLGCHDFYRYAALREQATNLQGSFSVLEPKLKRAVALSAKGGQERIHALLTLRMSKIVL